MTSVEFQIDSRAMRVLQGQPAESYERRRERERTTAQIQRYSVRPQDQGGSAGRLVEALSLLDRTPANRSAAVTANNQPPASAARFLAAGGQPLDLDRLDYEDLYNMFPSHAPRGAGADVINNCSNVFKYRVQNRDGMETCTICLVDFEDGDEIRLLPCLHAYHKNCADEWLKNHRSCPVCKTDIQTLVSEIPRITGKGLSSPARE